MSKNTFKVSDLKRLVDCAGRALEAEEAYLVSCPAKPGTGKRLHGLLQNPNERYYQFLIWRGLMSDASFAWRAMTERYGHDLVFYEGDSDRPVAFAEIKGWWSDSGEQEIPGIRRDIEKLQMRKVPGVMLVITCSNKGKTAANVKWLAGKLKIDHERVVTYCFETVYSGESPLEFAVLGFLAEDEALAASV